MLQVQHTIVVAAILFPHMQIAAVRNRVFKDYIWVDFPGIVTDLAGD